MGNTPSAEPVQFKYEANLKGKITLQCKLENIPNDINKTVTWCRRHRYNGTKQILDVRTERSSQTSLEIESCEAKDSGFYSCMVRYGRKEISSKEIELCVYGLVSDTTSYSFDFGSTAVLKFELIDRPMLPYVQWYHSQGGVLQLIAERKSKYFTHAKKDAALVIFNIDEHDQGLYECKLRYTSIGLSGREWSESISLRVNETLSVVAPELRYTVQYGQYVTLKCGCNGGPPARRIEWEKDGKRLTAPLDGSKYIGSTVDSPSLTILNTNYNDNGIYTCIAITCNREILKGNSIDLSVDKLDGNLAMKILKSKYTVSYGENVSLECIWNGGSLPTSFTWYKSGKAIDLDTDNRKYLGSTVHSPSLHVLNVDEKDNDTYTCVASRKFEDKLEHLESPKINLSVNILEKLSISVSNTQYTVQLKDPVTLKCRVSGNPSPTVVYWLQIKDGTELRIRRSLHKSKYLLTENNQHLKIINADDNDGGVYKCAAVNKDSEVHSQNIYVRVFGGYETTLETFKLSSVIVPDLQKSPNLKYMPDACILKERLKINVTDINQLKVGVQVSFARPGYCHHGIVTNIWLNKKSYEIIHLTGTTDTILDKHVNGKAEIRKQVKHFNDDKIKVMYDYGNYSIGEIIRKKHSIGFDNLADMMVLKRASVLYEAFETFKRDIYYNVLSFNCEHFASYCATGLAYCKQQELLTVRENTEYTAFLDKKLTIYCNNMLGMKRPSDAILKQIQDVCVCKSEQDIRRICRDLNRSTLCSLSYVIGLEEGMGIIIQKGDDICHAIVTNVCYDTGRFDVVTLLCDNGVADCQSMMMVIDEGINYKTYNIRSNIYDKDITKVRAEILYKSIHTLNPKTKDAQTFKSEHFTSYCIAGLAWCRGGLPNHNQTATHMFDNILKDYCQKFIHLPVTT